ncbi:pimeloyl-ACP methyl ester carboxylesterase [Rhizobium sp. RAS22]|nr:pimeloyl-ACP methyl ester carboxylesterase [Rhizobium sp. RAS22]
MPDASAFQDLNFECLRNSMSSLTEPHNGTEALSALPPMHMKLSLKLVSLGLVALVVLPLAVGSVYEVLSRNWVKAKYPPPGRLIDVGGRNIHLDCRGQGSPTVILEAGLDNYGTLSWAKVHDSVALLTRACAYDRAGIMWSEPKATPQYADAVAEDLRAVLTAAREKGPFILVGHSIGGPYSMAYTRKFGDEVAGLVFVDASHPDQVARFAEVANTPPDYINEVMQIASSLAWTGIIRLMATADEAHDVPVRVTEKANAFISTSLAAVVSENMNVDRTLGEAGGLRTLGDRPLVVLTAMAPLGNDALNAAKMSRQEDTRRRDVWRKLHEDEASWSTRSRHQLLPDSGHYIQFTRPDAVIAAILEVVNHVRLENTGLGDLRRWQRALSASPAFHQ